MARMAASVFWRRLDTFHVRLSDMLPAREDDAISLLDDGSLIIPLLPIMQARVEVRMKLPMPLVLHDCLFGMRPRQQALMSVRFRRNPESLGYRGLAGDQALILRQRSYRHPTRT